MTINSETRVAGPFTGNGSASSFPFAFKVFSADQVLVVRAEGGEEEALVLDVGYTVSLNVDQDAAPGGTVTLLGGPLAPGQTLVLTSDVDPLQPVDLTNQGGFYPRVISTAFDRLTILVQQLEVGLRRSVKVPLSEIPEVGAEAEAFALPSRAARKGAVLAFHETTGDPVVGPSVATVGTVAANVQAIATVAANVGDVATVADNIEDVTNFADVYYGPSATDPTTRRDGSPLHTGDMYYNTQTNGVLTYSAELGVWKALPFSAHHFSATFSGDGVETEFTLPYDPAGQNNVQVFIHGVYQQKATYSVAGTTLTFDVAPPVGVDNIEVILVAVAQADEGLRGELAERNNPTLGAALVGYAGGTVAGALTSLATSTGELTLALEELAEEVANLEPGGGGGGPLPFSVVLVEDVPPGAFVYTYEVPGEGEEDPGTYCARLAGGNLYYRAHGFVLAGGVADATVEVTPLGGENTALFGLTPGREYYLSTTMPGDIQETPPLAGGMLRQELGFAVSSTTLLTSAGLVVELA